MTDEEKKEFNNLIYLLEIHHIETKTLFKMKNLIQKQQEELERYKYLYEKALNDLVQADKKSLDKDKIIDEIKIRACSVHHLIRQIRGRKDCTIFIPYSCSKEIERMDYSDYLILEEDLKARNIKLKVEDK